MKNAFLSGGVGFMLLDTDSRAHHAFDLCNLEKQKVGWTVGWYEIKPGTSMELQWELNFMPDGDYFSFINTLRKELKLNNVTIDGSFNFANVYDLAENMTDEAILKAIKKHNIKYLITWGGYVWPNPAKSSPPYDIIYGSAVMYSQYSGYLDNIRKAAARLKKLAPSVKLLPYFHPTLLGTAIPEDIERFKGEICYNQDGTMAARRWKAYQKGSKYKKNTLCISMLPTNDSPYAKEIEKVMDYYINNLGVGGFFFDEISGDFYDYKKLDNSEPAFSNYIDIDSDGQVYRVRSVGIRANNFMTQLLQGFKDRNISAFGNGGNLDLYFRGINSCPVFSEARLNLYQPAFSVHLNTPIALWYRPTVETVRMLLNEGLIPGGTSIKWENNLIAHLYPFTPQKIGKGFVIGKEALITAKEIKVPNEFLNSELKKYMYNSKGIMKETEVSFLQGEKLQVPQGGFIILRK